MNYKKRKNENGNEKEKEKEIEKEKEKDNEKDNENVDMDMDSIGKNVENLGNLEKEEKINGKFSQKKKVEDEFRKVFDYPYKIRERFFNRIIESPGSHWPAGNDWSYKNNRK